MTSYRNFSLLRKLPLQELHSTLAEWVHEPSGAKILHIENDDPENLFCLSFQTWPNGSHGVAHILEHTVLCGSKKFPVKDPFFAMTRRSLNTFMNALTGQDFTCYPASSQVEKDFYNLLEIYLDAVFFPSLKKESFLQEGWRLELSDPEHKKGPLHYQGVVYNEMKGAMGSIDSRLWKAVAKRLMPDLPYSYNSGGDPKEIPTLTYEGLLDFHKTFYHPSRCLFFFYGNLPLEKHLDFIEERVLKGAKKLPPLSPLPLQKRFSRPVAEVERYPVSREESLEKKCWSAFAWLTVPVSEQKEVLALSLLDSILSDTDASPLKKAMLESKLCTQFDSLLDPEMSEVPWLIVCKGCEEGSQEALKKRLFEELERLTQAPFAEELIASSLHQLEFERSEIAGEGGPFGLTLFMRSALLKQHGCAPERGLLIHTLFEELKGALQDPMYLPKLLKKYLVDNPHRVELLMKPDPELEREEKEEEERRLAAIEARLTDGEKEALAQQAKRLATYQEEVEHQSLDCLPTVELTDIPAEPVDFQLENPSPRVFHHPCFTNHIVYADLAFDLPKVEEGDLSLLALYARILPHLGAGGRSYEENLAFQQAYIGGFDATVSLHLNALDPGRCRPAFTLRGKALSPFKEKLFELFEKSFASPRFDEAKRIEGWLEQQATALQSRLSKSGLTYAVQEALAPFSSPSFVQEKWGGISYYQQALEWAKSPPKLADWERIHRRLLSAPSPDLILSCETKEGAALRFAHSPLPSFSPWEMEKVLPPAEGHVRLIASPVAFTAYGMRTISYQHGDAPCLLLAAELLDNVFLHTEVREKGGAYGSGASYSPSSGNFHLYAYRDPNLSRTLTLFDRGLEKIGDKKFTERELFEAKLCVIQTLDTPTAPGMRAMTAYAWHRAERSFEARRAFRHRLLSATSAEVAEAVKLHLLPRPKVAVSYLGKELWEKERKKLKRDLPVFPLLGENRG